MWVRMSVPATFPATASSPLFNIVQRKIVSREPPDIDANCTDRLRVSMRIEFHLKQSWLVRLRLESGFNNKCVGSELLLKEP